jgi:hypothetical protein
MCPVLRGVGMLGGEYATDPGMHYSPDRPRDRSRTEPGTTSA